VIASLAPRNTMDIITTILDFILHIDAHLADIITLYGPWIYGILFLIVFCETGLVVTPFLPGDSLLFAAGALAASTGQMSVILLWVLLSIAAILGDGVNYFIGRRVGTRVFSDNARILKTDYLRRTEAFYEKHGNKTIILARFVPIVRTFAPFVAGVGNMEYKRFATYNVVGGLLWVTLFLAAGFLFGNIPFVKENFEFVTIGIILVSVLPMVFEFLKERKHRQQALQRR
jgi:membrane-associated protein